MSIVSSELVWRKPLEVSDSATNGGRMSSIAAISNVKNNIFPDVPQSERTAGSTKYRKMFIHVANDLSLSLIAPKVFVAAPTPGDDRVLIFPGTQTNMQSAITGSEQLYGAGTLNTNASLGATTCSVLVEAAADAIFKSGMMVRISNKPTVDAAGDEQYLTLSSDASYVGNVATLTFTATPLAYNFLAASPTYVSSCIEPSTVAPSISGWSETSGSGVYDETTYPVQLNSISTIQQTWTLLFTSASTFNISGDTLGLIGTGTIGSNSLPNHAAFGRPYFTLLSAGFSGTWANGNSIVFTTVPASIPVWYKRVTPPGAVSLSGNKIVVGVDGESA